MKKIAVCVIAALCLLGSREVYAACANTLAIKDGNNAGQLLCVGNDGGSNLMLRQQIVDGTAGANALGIDSSNRAKVIADAGTNLNTSALALETGGNLATLAGAVSASKFNVNLSSVAACLHLSVNVDQIGGGTMATAATGTQKVGITGNAGAAFDAAGQNVASPANEILIGCQFNTTPTTITSTNMSPVECDNGGNLQANLKTVTGVITAATSPASMVMTGAVFNTALPTVTNGQSAALQSDASGRLIISPTSLEVAQASTTSAQVGPLIQCAVTTSAPSYTTAQTDPCSLTTAGELRVNLSSGALAAGANVIGKVGVDQTTPGTTNAVQEVSGTTGGLTWYFLQPAASDNHTNIKNGAGQVYEVVAFNNSATINYLRFYNAATGFNGCNSATNIVAQFIIPGNSTNGAGFVIPIPLGLTFSTGISICVTSAYAQTDTTNATASAMALSVGYK